MNVFTVYKTIHLSTGRYYYGFHETDNPTDNYLGSGIWVKHALKKYGRKDFRKDILFTYPTDVEAYTKEMELIKLAGSDSLCLNLHEGGKGGFHYINDNGLSNYFAAACAGGKKASESGQAACAAAVGRQKMAGNGTLYRLGCRQGRKNVESGFLAKLRTPEHQSAAAKVSGSKAAETGRIQAVGRKYGGKVPIEACTRGGAIAGKIAVENGQLEKARKVVTPAKIGHLFKANHIRWHVNRNIINEHCELCRGMK